MTLITRPPITDHWPPTTESMPDILLEVEKLQTCFDHKKVVKDVSFSVEEGEILGIVGESGCGKSVTALSIMQLIELPGKVSNGSIIFNLNGNRINLLNLTEKELESILGNRIAMVFQDPMSSLNPVLSIGYQVAETLRVHQGLSKNAAKEQAISLLERVGISDARQRINDYPHEFSGGMRQRVMIAMAISCQPKLLIADEPTTALDMTIQAQILDLLREFRKEFGMSIIIITHDLGVVAQIADRVAVMYAGRIVENAPVEAIFQNARHPYTMALINSIPSLNLQPERLQTIEGVPPLLQSEEPMGCSFYERCPVHLPICAEKRPVSSEIGIRHQVSCWHIQEGVPANV